MEQNQKPVKMDVDVKERMEDFLDSDLAKQHGFKSKADFVNEAVNILLKKYESKRFKHFNFEDNVIRLIDNQLPEYRDLVEIRLKGKVLLCGDCHAKKCIHIDAVRTDVKISKILTDKGI